MAFDSLTTIAIVTVIVVAVLIAVWFRKSFSRTRDTPPPRDQEHPSVLESINGVPPDAEGTVTLDVPDQERQADSGEPWRDVQRQTRDSVPPVPDREEAPQTPGTPFRDELHRRATQQREFLDTTFGRPEDAHSNTGPRADLDQLLNAHQIPGIRLPNETKTAFSEAKLFAQQSNMHTFDHGLQAVLDVLELAVQGFAGCEQVPLRDFLFTMNFADAASTGSKRFSVKMVSPLNGQLDLIQELQEGSLHPRWYALHNGERFTPLRREPQVQVEALAKDTPARERIIQLDDTDE